MDFEKIYPILLNDLSSEQIREVNSLFSEDNYKERVKYICKKWPKQSPPLFEESLNNVSINNFSALSSLIKQLLKKGLLLKNNIFSYIQTDDERYIISINRNDRKKIHVYCSEEGDKSQIIKEINLFQWKYKKMMILKK